MNEGAVHWWLVDKRIVYTSFRGVWIGYLSVAVSVEGGVWLDWEWDISEWCDGLPACRGFWMGFVLNDVSEFINVPLYACATTCLYAIAPPAHGPGVAALVPPTAV